MSNQQATLQNSSSATEATGSPSGRKEDLLHDPACPNTLGNPKQALPHLFQSYKQCTCINTHRVVGRSLIVVAVCLPRVTCTARVRSLNCLLKGQ